MATKPKVCARCSGAMNPATLDKATAADGPLRLSLLGAPVFSCAKGHRAPVHREFMVWLLHELRDKHAPAIPGGEAKGSMRRCSSGSSVVTEIATLAASYRASSASRSASRVTRKPFVMIATGFLNSASTARQRRVSSSLRSAGW